jgi:hypothetical protein
MGVQRENLISRLIPCWFRRVFSRRAKRPPFPLVIKLTAGETARLLAHLESPPPPNDELKKALALYKEVFGSNP